MKMYVGFILLCLFWVNQSVAQCAFQINKFIEEDQLAHVQTESKQIYESEEKLKSLGFSFGNIGADYYFIALTPELDEIWEVNKGDGLTFKFANNGLLYVDFDSFVASNEAYTPSGPYDRKSKEVRYFLPSKKLSQFIGSELVEIYFRYNGDGISIPIEEPMKKMHAQMFDCLYGRVEGYRMKYPNMSYDQYLQAQKKADENPEEKDLNLADSSIYKVVEVMPRFPGCESELAENKEKENCAKTKMLQYVYANLVYPEEAKSLELEGLTFVQFVVNQDGSISNITLIRDIGSGCGEEAVRIVASMNDLEENWSPGEAGGKLVRVLYTLPISFKLKG